MKENGNEVKKNNVLGRFFASRAIWPFGYSVHVNRAFKEWKEDYEFLTELVLVLNHKVWQYHEKRPEFAELYNTLWEQTDQYAMENLKDEELSYFFDVTD